MSKFIRNEITLWKLAFTWKFWKLFLTGKLG